MRAFTGFSDRPILCYDHSQMDRGEIHKGRGVMSPMRSGSVRLFPAAASVVLCLCLLLAPPARCAPPKRANRTASAAKPALKYRLAKKRLSAVDKRTGKVRWAFGRNLVERLDWYDKTLYAYDNDDKAIYVYSQDGRVYCIDRWKGRLLWSVSTGLSKETPEITGLFLDRDTLLVPHFGGIIVYQADSGRELWRIKEGRDEENWFNGGLGLESVRTTTSTVLLCYWSSGAYSHGNVKAYDRRTGRFLWHDNASVTNVAGDKVYLTSLFPSDPPVEDRYMVDARTCKLLAHKELIQGVLRKDLP